MGGILTMNMTMFLMVVSVLVNAVHGDYVAGAPKEEANLKVAAAGAPESFGKAANEPAVYLSRRFNSLAREADGPASLSMVANGPASYFDNAAQGPVKFNDDVHVPSSFEKALSHLAAYSRIASRPFSSSNDVEGPSSVIHFAKEPEPYFLNVAEGPVELYNDVLAPTTSFDKAADEPAAFLKHVVGKPMSSIRGTEDLYAAEGPAKTDREAKAPAPAMKGARRMLK